MTPSEGLAQDIKENQALTGAKRQDVMGYYFGVITGRYGPVSRAGVEYAQTMLDAMRRV